MMLVTLQQARDHLRSDTTADDNDLILKIHAASAAVMNYLKDAIFEFTDSAGDVILDSNLEPEDVPYEVQAATLIMIGVLYKDRDASSQFDRGYLPEAVMSLLYPLRKPASE